MPYKTERVKLDSAFIDKRVKLLPCQKEMVVYWTKQGLSQRQLARMFNVSRRLITFIQDPKKKEKDLQKLQTFNRILNRIHEKIKMTSRQKMNNSFCWYVIPELLLGCVNYDRAMCISYVLAKLEENDFQVRYTHPNLIFISWGHYIPTYLRNEFKKIT